jgi:hydroxypyruvate reductase
MTISDPRLLLTALFDAAVAAADPMRIVPHWLPPRPRGRTVVVGAGKAAAAMALAFEQAWDGPLSGVVVAPHGSGGRCEHIRVLEAAHPVPDAAGVAAARALVGAVTGLTSADLVVALVSGGGSALLAAPPPGLGLADEQALNLILLQSGLPIAEMNLLRKHASTIKGGRLAEAAAPAKVVTLVLSDVPGDDPSEVASGPTVPSDGTAADALAIVERNRLALPPVLIDHLRSAPAAPIPGDPAFLGHEAHVIASSALSLAAAARLCRERFALNAAILSDAIEGEAAPVARMHAAIARQVAQRNQPFAAPILLLSGGETTVTVQGSSGKGGRNSEFALALALDLDGLGAVHALAADTDGIDGNHGAAGAFVDGTSIGRLRQAGLDPRAMLAGHDSGTAFAAIGDLFFTGATGTNVNDFRAIFVGRG